MGPEFFLLGKIFILITGASKGIGRQLAITLSQVVQNDSHFILLARNITGLQETASKMSKCVKVNYVSADLSITQADQLADIINKRINPNDYDNAIVIHNVGSTGDVNQLTDEMDNFKVWEKMYDLNVFSPAVLNSVFMKIFNDEFRAKKLVINLTSFASKIPFPSGAYYCSAKAAREMYFEIFAKEFPNVNVLNYSPYIVYTDLLKEIKNIKKRPDVPELMEKNQREGKILTPTQVAERLVEIIRRQKYKSGDYVDYYDPL